MVSDYDNVHDTPERRMTRLRLRQSAFIIATIALEACGDSGSGADGGTGPTGQTGSARFKAVSAGAYYTCGVLDTGAAKCWGDNFGGQLGTGTADYRAVPVAVAGGLRFTIVSASALRHACGLTTDGAAYCWGEYGLLGTGQLAGSLAPVAVAGGHTFTAVSVGGSHTCALTAAGAAYCWGSNAYGALGDGTTADALTPVEVVGGHHFTAISAGGNHTCAIAAGGAAFCWGLNGPNAEGLLGMGTTTGPDDCLGFQCSLVPMAVTGEIVFASITASRRHTCGLTPVGAAYCWGTNANGQLGDGTTVKSPEPVRAAPAVSFVALSAGSGDGDDAQTCGLTAAGAALCWGFNEHGQLGNGTTSASNTNPVSVVGGLAYSSISVGREHVCGLTRDGVLYCWGGNSNGSLGIGSNVEFSTTPVRVAGQQ